MRLTFVLAAIMLAAASCTAPSYSSDATYRLMERTLGDLEKRVSLSEQRIYVAPFFASDREGEQETRLMHEEMATQHRNTARLLRHEVLGFLAPRMYVLDLPDTGEVSGLSPEEKIYEMANESGATLILFGRYSMEAAQIRIMLRVVDASTKTILVAEDGLVGHVETHGYKQKMPKMP